MKKRKKDFIILLSILGAALILFALNHFYFRNKGQTYCEIYIDGELMETVNLSKNRQFSIDEKPNIKFEVKEHSIAFVESDCPDKVCIHSGFLSQTGQSASCLPNKTTITIRSGKDDPTEPDIVVGGIYEKKW